MGFLPRDPGTLAAPPRPGEARLPPPRARPMLRPGQERGNGMTQRAMVTGAGSGLGRAVAQGLAARGCALALMDIDEAAARATAAACPGAPAILVHDLADPAGPAAAVAGAIAALGGLEVVVNNAGYGAAEGFFAMTA